MSDAHDFAALVRDELLTTARLIEATTEGDVPTQVAQAAAWCIESLRAAGTIYYLGNGGSAAEALHMAAELGGHLELDREPLSSVALGANPSMVTAIGNDYAFAEIFARELAVVRPGDVVFALTTSGRSANVLRAIEVARERGARVIAITGRTEAPLLGADLHIRIPSPRTRNVQEASLAIGHLICLIVERAFAPGATD